MCSPDGYERWADNVGPSMNWEAISAIGQVLGAFGVIASLIYLGTQVRQSNRASAVAGKLASAQLLREFVDSPITDPTLIDLSLWGSQKSEAPQQHRAPMLRGSL